MMDNFFKVNRGKDFLIAIPNNKNRLIVSLVGTTIEKNELIVVPIKINNRDVFNQLTNNILEYYINIEMLYHLKYYSIDYEGLIYFEIV